MQPEPNSLNIGVPTLKLIYHYLDAIFVPPVLGTCQGMSTKVEDRKMYENLHKLDKLEPKCGKMPKMSLVNL